MSHLDDVARLTAGRAAKAGVETPPAEPEIAQAVEKLEEQVANDLGTPEMQLKILRKKDADSVTALLDYGNGTTHEITIRLAMNQSDLYDRDIVNDVQSLRRFVLEEVRDSVGPRAFDPDFLRTHSGYADAVMLNRRFLRQAREIVAELASFSTPWTQTIGKGPDGKPIEIHRAKPTAHEIGLYLEPDLVGQIVSKIAIRLDEEIEALKKSRAAAANPLVPPPPSPSASKGAQA
jgi:hypothetical protein